MAKGTPGFNGEKLSQALKIRRIKPISLAKEIGLTRASVSAYEKNLRTPSPEITGEICRILDMPLDFFVNNSTYIPESESPVFYRSNVSTLKQAREAAEEKHKIFSSIVAYLGQYVSFPSPNIPMFDVPSDPTMLSDDEIAKISEKTRKFWGLSLGPISDLICLLENNGIFVGKFPFYCNKLDAFSQNIEGRLFQIIIASDKGSAVRQRYNASHELGHIILHRKVPRGVVRDKYMHALLERQANYFAFEFLFPTPAFRDEVKRCNLSEFKLLKRKWKVSIAAQVQRACRADISTKAEMAPLQRAISRKGWRTQEPFDDEFICEEPRLAQEAFQIILETQTQSPKDIYNYFHLHFSDIEEIVGLPQGYLSSFSQPPVVKLKNEFHQRKTSDTTEDSRLSNQKSPSQKGDETNILSFMDAFAEKN